MVGVLAWAALSATMGGAALFAVAAAHATWPAAVPLHVRVGTAPPHPFVQCAMDNCACTATAVDTRCEELRTAPQAGQCAYQYGGDCRSYIRGAPLPPSIRHSKVCDFTCARYMIVSLQLCHADTCMPASSQLRPCANDTAACMTNLATELAMMPPVTGFWVRNALQVRLSAAVIATVAAWCLVGALLTTAACAASTRLAVAAWATTAPRVAWLRLYRRYTGRGIKTS